MNRPSNYGVVMMGLDDTLTFSAKTEREAIRKAIDKINGRAMMGSLHKIKDIGNIVQLGLIVNGKFVEHRQC